MSLWAMTIIDINPLSYLGVATSMMYINLHLYKIWEGTPELLMEFFDALNKDKFNLTFTIQFDRPQISFLDVLVKVDPTGKLMTDLYRKPTAGNALLGFDSAHSVPLKQSIPFGQYLRLRHICTDTETFQLQAQNLRERLREGGYSKSVLKKAYHHALSFNRDKLLYRTAQKKNSDKIRCIMTYSQMAPTQMP